MPRMRKFRLIQYICSSSLPTLKQELGEGKS